MKLPPERCFHFPDGTSASSLDELRDKIETISYNTFYHHVDSSKNDFASWVRYVLKDPRLADELEKVNSIVETVEILNDYMHPNLAKNSADTIQSKIEKQIGFVVDKIREPAPPIEPVPEIPPKTEETQQLVTEPVAEEPAEPVVAEPVVEPKPAREPRAQKSSHYQRRQGELSEIDSFHDDMTKLIVKDFIWGMLFGLILGFLLARMLGL